MLLKMLYTDATGDIGIYGRALPSRKRGDITSLNTLVKCIEVGTKLNISGCTYCKNLKKRRELNKGRFPIGVLS